jgi:hypothetical protein
MHSQLMTSTCITPGVLKLRYMRTDWRCFSLLDRITGIDCPGAGTASLKWLELVRRLRVEPVQDGSNVVRCDDGRTVHRTASEPATNTRYVRSAGMQGTSAHANGESTVAKTVALRASSSETNCFLGIPAAEQGIPEFHSSTTNSRRRHRACPDTLCSRPA